MILAMIVTVEVVEHLQLGMLYQVGKVLDGMEHGIHHLGKVLHVLLALAQLGGQIPCVAIFLFDIDILFRQFAEANPMAVALAFGTE